MTTERDIDRSRAANDPRDRDRVLWVNVVLQAIKDAMEGGAATKGNARELERRRARLWFNLSNPDFIEVCHCAHLDPAATYEKAMHAIERYDAISASGEKYRVEREQPKAKPRAPKLYTVNDKSHTLAEWSTILGVDRTTLDSRLRSGYTAEEAFSPNFKRRPRVRTRPPRRYSPGRPPKHYSFNGVSKSLAQWSQEAGLDHHTVLQRLHRGMPLEVALSLKLRGGRAKHHTINGVSKTLEDWAKDAGITKKALVGRMAKGRTLAEALAMPNGRHPEPGVVFNFAGVGETGARGSAQERPEITFSAEATTE
ncbi:MAG: hypothetical protein KL801_12535 [Mesorhizobium sp.]|nr:hypothetical protein [Mesorhizobium sp.]